MTQDNVDMPGFTVAVFVNGCDRMLVRMEVDSYERAAADAVAAGFSYAGFISVIEGVPRVECEPGFAAAMLASGEVFAEMFGPFLQEYQLARQARESGSNG